MCEHLLSFSIGSLPKDYFALKEQDNTSLKLAFSQSELHLYPFALTANFTIVQLLIIYAGVIHMTGKKKKGVMSLFKNLKVVQLCKQLLLIPSCV